MNFDFQQFLGRMQGYDKESFIEAVMYGDENMLEQMSGSLTDSMIINEYLDIGENHEKMTALYYAVVFGTKDRIVSILTNTKKIDVNKGHVSGRTPLVAAVIHNRAYAIKQLCKNQDSDVSYQDWKESPEKQSVMFDKKATYPLVVRLAVEGKAVPDICEPDKKNKDGDTLVHMAVEAEQVDSIKHLRRKGYNFNIQNRNGDTPLHVALRVGNLEIIHMLCNHEELFPNVCNNNGDRALHQAVAFKENKFAESAKILLTRKESDLNIQNKDKETPLHVALKSGNTNIVDTILELNDEKIDLNLCDKKGNTALHLALKGNFFEIAERLIDRDKVDPNIANENNETVLHLAVPKKATNIIKRVCEKQSIIYNFTTKNIEGKTAFDMNTAIRGKITEAEYSSILLVGIKTVSQYDEDWDHIDAKHFQIKDELITVIQSNDIPKILEKLLEKKEGVTSTLEYLQETMNKKEEHNSACAALLKFIIKGVEKFANQSRLKYVFYESSNFNVLIKIFVEGYDNDKNSPFLVHLLSILYISLQANISCKCTEIEPVAEEKLAMRTTRQYMTDALKEKLYPESLLEVFKRQIQEIVLNVGKGEKLNKTQLIAHNIDELYFKCESKSSTCSCSPFLEFVERQEKRLNSCLHVKKLFHPCIVRKNYSFIPCLLWIGIHVFDIVSDAMLSFKTLNEFSRRLGILMLVLVCGTLIHENFRSTISTYQADKQLLRITLGKFDLEPNDYKSDKTTLNYYKNFESKLVRYTARFLWPFKVNLAETTWKLRSILFNILSLLMLRPIVDRLVFLTHSATNLRVIYRQKAEQAFLSQYYLITEQLPELLIQFYVFQIYFNKLETPDDYGRSGCTEEHSFAYDHTYFKCVQDLPKLKLCASWLEICSMLVPFFKIPISMMCLENMCRILHPGTKEMSCASSSLLHLAYIFMIPSRLFLFAAAMHSAPDHLYVGCYLLMVTFLTLAYNGRYVEGKEKDKRHIKDLLASLVNVWSLLLFSFRDVMVISVRQSHAYLMSPSEVTHKSLRSWKEVLMLSYLKFFEGLVGAVYVERQYPCGRNSHIFKYQGWLYLTLYIVSCTMVTLLSYTFQPIKYVIIPSHYRNRLMIIFLNGLTMWTITVATFFATRISDPGNSIHLFTVAVISLVFVTFLLAAAFILGKWGEAKKKKCKTSAEEQRLLTST